LKTLDAVQGHCGKPHEIKPSLGEFEALLAQEEKANAQKTLCEFILKARFRVIWSRDLHAT
jgi:hypothetical protein